MTDTAELITIPHKTDVPALFSEPGGIEKLVERIEKEALSYAVDASTPTGRKEAKSLAAKVSRSKTLIDEVGKEQNEERNRLNKEVNALRNLAKERLDALRDTIRAPVEAWEQQEADRVRELEQRMDTFAESRASGHDPSQAISDVIADIEATQIDDTWQEYEADARAAKAKALDKYRNDLAIAKQREDQEAELAKLRAEAEARAAADAEREAKEAAERAEQERKEREAKAKAEYEQKAKEAAERAAKEAEEKAARELAEAKEKHAKELAEAKLRAEYEQRQKEEEEAKRAADRKHRLKIRQDALDALEKLAPENLNEVVDYIIEGKVPHIKVAF